MAQSGALRFLKDTQLLGDSGIPGFAFLVIFLLLALLKDLLGIIFSRILKQIQVLDSGLVVLSKSKDSVIVVWIMFFVVIDSGIF